MDLKKLKIKLSKFGSIATIKEGYAFSLLMFSENSKISKNFFEILQLVTEYTHEKYPAIEAMRNEDNYFMCVLKPKKDVETKTERIAMETEKNLELIGAFVEHVKLEAEIEIPENVVISFFEP